MGKRKHRKQNAGKPAKASATGAAAREVSASQPDPSGTSPRPPGQRFYDLPYGAPAPRLINPALGLHNLVARAGHNAAYEIDVTLLDAPDHRLIRSGVLLAHRVLDGRGEWFMTAPDWQPLLPKDRVELMGHADLPEQLADLIRPLRRRATLGPVAALNCDRREFALRDEDGTTLALLRDDKVTVRRGGLTTARYREVMITPVGPGLTDEQTAFVDRSLVQANATWVPRLPRLVTRLGAPATGPTDIPVVAPYDAAAPFRRFVSQMLALRLRRMVEADLAVRGGDLSGVDRLAEQAELLRRDLQGLSALLDADWVEDLYDELGWLTVAPPGDGRSRDEWLAGRIRSERYLTVLERLVVAVRSPKLAEPRPEPAGEVLSGLAALAIGRLRRVADRMTTQAPDGLWEEALQEVSRLDHVLAVVREVLTEDASAVAQVVTPLRTQLTEIQAQIHREQAALAAVATLSVEEAFAAGRAFERQARKGRRMRRAFVAEWSRARKRLPA